MISQACLINWYLVKEIAVSYRRYCHHYRVGFRNRRIMFLQNSNHTFLAATNEAWADSSKVIVLSVNFPLKEMRYSGSATATRIYCLYSPYNKTELSWCYLMISIIGSSLNNSLIYSQKLLSANYSSTAIRISTCKLFSSMLLIDFNKSCFFFFFLGMTFIGIHHFYFTVLFQEKSYSFHFQLLQVVCC